MHERIVEQILALLRLGGQQADRADRKNGRPFHFPVACASPLTQAINCRSHVHHCHGAGVQVGLHRFRAAFGAVAR
ncbi:MAG TPA: hypothetical protein VNN06_18120, partial [Ramlibacter sp.]|nr:hypothetical protein [Ramlibacter sp.]